jgi:DNA modification methylase
VANSFVAQTSLNFTGADRSRVNVPEFAPLYATDFGSAYCADALEVLKVLPEGSTNLVLTSPPYALHFKKEYGNVEKKEYIDWFMRFAEQIFRVLPDDGSFVLNIGGSYNAGQPTRSLYHFKLLIALVEDLGFYLAQECFWYNPAKMPMPAEWVNVRRIRVKDSVEYIWWLSKTPNPKASNLKVLNPYSQDMIRLNQRGLKKAVRPSGHNIKPSFSQIDAGGSIPSNVIEENISAENMLIFGNNAANDAYAEGCKQAGIKRHPARFPSALPDFFIKLLTDEGDLILDPFAGSNTTGAVAEKLQRFWIAVDNTESYLEGSKYRFFQSS